MAWRNGVDAGLHCKVRGLHIRLRLCLEAGAPCGARYGCHDVGFFLVCWS